MDKLKQDYKLIQKLYKLLPKFECKKNCHRCCGVIPWTRAEWHHIPPEKRKVQTEITCPYLTKNGCSIYEYRPLMCRAYGTINTRMLRCPEGCGPTFLLDEQIAKALIFRHYMQFEIIDSSKLTEKGERK